MFCPGCGQRQLSDEVRFCPRCGLPLAAHAQLLASGEEADGAWEQEEPPGLSPRQRGVRKGLIWMAAGLVFGLIVLLLTALQEDFFVFLVAAALLIAGGLVRLLHAALLEEGAAPAGRKKLAEAGPTQARGLRHAPGARGAELPPARETPADYLARRVETAEIASPPSVTEGTTRLLKDE